MLMRDVLPGLLFSLGGVHGLARLVEAFWRPKVHRNEGLFSFFDGDNAVECGGGAVV